MAQSKLKYKADREEGGHDHRDNNFYQYMTKCYLATQEVLEHLTRANREDFKKLQTAGQTLVNCLTDQVEKGESFLKCFDEYYATLNQVSTTIKAHPGKTRRALYFAENFIEIAAFWLSVYLGIVFTVYVVARDNMTPQADRQSAAFTARVQADLDHF